MADQTASPMFNPMIMGPDAYTQQLKLQQQQALANALMQKGLTPIDPNRHAGGVNGGQGYVVPISPVEGLSSVAQALAGALMQKNIIGKQADLVQKQREAYLQSLGFGGGPQTAAGGPQAQAGQQPAPTSLAQGSTSQAAPQMPQQPMPRQTAPQQPTAPPMSAPTGGQGQITAPQGLDELANMAGMTPQQLAFQELNKPGFIAELRAKLAESAFQSRSKVQEFQQTEAPYKLADVQMKIADLNEKMREFNTLSPYQKQQLAIDVAKLRDEGINIGGGGGQMPTAPQAAGGRAPTQGVLAQDGQSPDGIFRDKTIPQTGPNLFNNPANLSPKQQRDIQAKQVGDVQSEFGKYETNLNDRVSTGREILNRSNEILPLLDQYKTGIPNADVRVKLAQYAQAFGSPDLAKKINGGDIAAAQELEKQFTIGALSQLRQTLNADGGQANRTNRAEFEVFQHANPNLETDPQAIRKIINFNNRIYQRDFGEQQYLAKNRPQTLGDMQNWQAKISDMRNQELQAEAQRVHQSTTAAGQRLSPEEAAKLPPGTQFIGLDGVPRTRH